MKIVECDQGSSAWFAERCGRVTASAIAKVMALNKSGKESEPRHKLKGILIAEMRTGKVCENFVSEAMAWGTITEPEARRAYALHNGVYVDQVGFVIHPTIDRSGASPDGLIDPDGGLEIKCPQTATHIDWILADEVPPEHEPQMAWGMACTGAAWWDFASYDPRIDKGLRLFVKRLHRDEQRIQELEAGVLTFLGELDDMNARLNALAPPESEPEQRRSQLNEQLEDSLALSAEDIEWAAQGFPERKSA